MKKPFSVLVALVFGLWAIISGVRAETLIDQSFGDATKPALGPNGQPSTQVSGVFPSGWSENSSNWTKVDVQCDPSVEDGVRFLRLDIKSIAANGRLLLCHPLPATGKETFYHLRMRVRAWNWDAPPALIGMRTMHVPYNYVWSTHLTTSSGWSDVDVRFELKNPGDDDLYLQVLDAGGKLDIAYLKLDEVSTTDLRAEADAAFPDHGPANLFRDSRFPLGLPSGWMISQQDSDQVEAPVPPLVGQWGFGPIHVEADPANLGPTGAPALKMESVEGKKVGVASEPFLPVYPFVAHAASFYAKGTGTWHCRVVVDEGANFEGAGPDVLSGMCADAAVTPGNKWTRITVPFSPREVADGYRIEFTGKTTLWIDGLQVGPQDKSGAYASAGDCEVALSVPDSDASDARIQFTDEPSQIAWFVTGKAPSGLLKFRVTNLYGEETALPDIPLSPALIGSRQTVDFSAALQTKPLGAFRLEAWVEADGKAISPHNEIVVNRLHRPHYWGKDAPHSPFGVHVAATTRNLILAKATGINWVRLHDVPYTWWVNLEPEKGRWNFYDGEIALYRKYKLSLLGEFGTAPKWASYYADAHKTTWDNGWDRWFQPKNLADYANYVTTVATRYKGVINDWDVWNEPWVFPFWAKGYDPTKPGLEAYLPGPHAQADYAALMHAADTAAHAVDPGCNVLGFNTTGVDAVGVRFSGKEWTEGVLQAGGLADCDTLCYHSYDGRRTGFPGDPIETALDAAFAPIREQNGGLNKPVWMTEGSPLSFIPLGFGLEKFSAFGNCNDNIEQDSERVAHFLLSLASRGVSRWFLFCLGSYTGECSPKWDMLITPDDCLHPCGVAHSAFAWLIEDKKFVRWHEVAPGVYAYLFRGGDEAVVVLSSKDEKAAFSLPTIAGAKALDLYGNELPAGSSFTGHLVYLTGQGAVADQLESALAPKS